jgi:hypothetical protein
VSALTFEKHLGLGLNIDTYKADLPGNQELKNDFSLRPTLGIQGIILLGNVGLRSGAFFEWKKVEVKDKSAPSSENDIDLTAYYVAIPVNLQFNLNESWSIFGGVTPRILISKTCDQCGSFDNDSRTFVNYSNIGLSHKFSKAFSADVAFNQALQDNFKDLKINTLQLLLSWQI